MGDVINRDTRFTGGAEIISNELTVVDGDGNVVGVVNTTNVTASGNTVLGDSVADSTTITGTTTITGPLLTNSTTVSSGAAAVAITGNIHEVTTTGADALTLADGAEGQVLNVVMVVDGGAGTLTPDNFASGTSVTFDDVGDTANLLFTNGSWFFMGGTGTVA